MSIKGYNLAECARCMRKGKKGRDLVKSWGGAHWVCVDCLPSYGKPLARNKHKKI